MWEKEQERVIEREERERVIEQRNKFYQGCFLSKNPFTDSLVAKNIVPALSRTHCIPHKQIFLCPQPGLSIHSMTPHSGHTKLALPFTLWWLGTDRFTPLCNPFPSFLACWDCIHLYWWEASLSPSQPELVNFTFLFYHITLYMSHVSIIGFITLTATIDLW